MGRELGDTIRWRTVNGFASGVIVGIWSEQVERPRYSVSKDAEVVCSEQKQTAYMVKTSNGGVIVREESIC